MMSSSSAIALIPAHPEPAEDQPAAIDEGNPQRERPADEEIADQRKRRDAEADRDEGIAEPQARDRIEQHEIDRPERSLLARGEMAEHIGAEISEREEQYEHHERPEVEGPNASPGIVHDTDRGHPGDA